MGEPLSLVSGVEERILDAAEPIVALIFPIATGAIGQEVHFGEIFDHLVAKLDGGVEAKRRTMIAGKVVAVHAIGKQRLGMHGAAEVP